MYLFHHIFPVGDIGHPRVKPELAAYHRIEAVLIEHQRRFVKAVHGIVFYDAVFFYIAEQGNLVLYRIFKGSINAGHDDVGMYSHGLKIFYGMLRGLALVLVGAGQIGHERNMDKQAVFPAFFKGNLSYRLDKWLTFDIADGSSNLRDKYIRVVIFTAHVNEMLYLLGDMRDYLHRLPEVFAFSFTV